MIQEFTTSSGDLPDLIAPAIEEADTYHRLTAYFTPGWFGETGGCLSSFFRSGGKGRWVVSPQLSEKAWKAIELGYLAREDPQLYHEILDETEGLPLDQLFSDSPEEALAYLVATEKASFKVAVPTGNLSGLFHDKTSIFLNGRNPVQVMQGSMNETKRSSENYESLLVLTGEDAEKADAERRFSQIWNNEEPNLDVLDFMDAIEDGLITVVEDNPPPDASRSSTFGLPATIDLRGYQQEAIQDWFAQKGTGIMSMATGTGKTITALAGLSHLRRHLEQKGSSLVTIIVCPYRHLVKQWGEEARAFGFEPVLCYDSWTSWFRRASEQLASVNTGASKGCVLITTTGTLRSEKFQNILERIDTNLLMLGDEVHNLGAEATFEALPPAPDFTLGLSATPERHYDEGGTSAVFDYFGGEVYEYGMEKAIDEGYLSPYEYHPVLVSLTPEEQEDYNLLSRKIAQRVSDLGDLDPEDDELKHLLIKRAKIRATASNKLEAFKSLLEGQEEETHFLVYCGTGDVESPTSEDEERQVDAVTKLLGTEMGLRVGKYVAETSEERRDELIQEFDAGRIQGLVAIRCLDEGVDIPSTRRAYILASTSNPRQWVQRRGRILRPSPGKDRAKLWDFIVQPPKGSQQGESFSIERNLLRSELKRVERFAELATNGPAAREELLPLKKEYNLLDL